ncbi:MAG: hypothetical protein PVH47_04885 [Thiohalocapsa sp.]|jgi:hypothetical protein
MPYFVYRIAAGPTDLIRNLELQKEFESFKDAKAHTAELRAQQAEDDSSEIRMIFADSALEAEERLQEHREAPILREWEK